MAMDIRAVNPTISLRAINAELSQLAPNQAPSAAPPPEPAAAPAPPIGTSWDIAAVGFGQIGWRHPYLAKAYDSIKPRRIDLDMLGAYSFHHVPTKIGQYVVSSYELEQRSERHDDLSFNANGNIYGVNLDVSSQFSRALIQTNYLFCMMVGFVFAEKRHVITTNPQLDPTIYADMQKLSPAERFARYGDSYCTEVLLGGYLFALLTFSSATREMTQHLAASIKANWGGTADAKAMSTLVEIEKEHKFHLQVRYAGLNHTTLPTEPSGLIDIGENIGNMIAGDGEIVAMRHMPYRDMVNANQALFFTLGGVQTELGARERALEEVQYAIVQIAAAGAGSVDKADKPRYRYPPSHAAGDPH